MVRSPNGWRMKVCASVRSRNSWESLRFSDETAAAALDRLERGLGLPSSLATDQVEPSNTRLEKDPKPHKDEKWQAWSAGSSLGYDPDFLPVNLDIHSMLGRQLSHAAPLLDDSGIVLDYLHFSSGGPQRTQVRDSDSGEREWR